MSSLAPNQDLLEQAKQLETQAIEQGEETAAGRELRGKAAALRVQALGERSYPLLVCKSCFRVTGWLSCDGKSAIRNDAGPPTPGRDSGCTRPGRGERHAARLEQLRWYT